MTAEEKEQLRKEEVRRAVRTYLALRPGLAFRASAIARNQDVNATSDEVDESLRVLIEFGEVATEKGSAWESTKYFKITAAGIAAHEGGK